MPRPSLGTHPRSYWKNRTPSFDGLHAKDFPEGWMFQNNAFQNYKRINGVWVEVGEEEWENPHPEYVSPSPPHHPTPPPPPRRGRGRPKIAKRQYNLQNPSNWSQFLSEQMGRLRDDPRKSQNKMEYIAQLWRNEKEKQNVATRNRQ